MLYERAGEPKQILELRGGHNDGLLISGAHCIDGFATFDAAVIDRKAPE